RVERGASAVWRYVRHRLTRSLLPERLGDQSAGDARRSAHYVSGNFRGVFAVEGRGGRVQSPKSKVQSAKSGVQSRESAIRNTQPAIRKGCVGGYRGSQAWQDDLRPAESRTSRTTKTGATIGRRGTAHCYAGGT